MPTRSVNLSSLTSGRFSNASESVREDLQIPEHRKPEDRSKIEWLRGAVQEGVDSIDRGQGIEFDTVDDLAAYVRRIGKEVTGELASKPSFST